MKEYKLCRESLRLKPVNPLLREFINDPEEWCDFSMYKKPGDIYIYGVFIITFTDGYELVYSGALSPAMRLHERLYENKGSCRNIHSFRVTRICSEEDHRKYRQQAIDSYTGLNLLNKEYLREHKKWPKTRRIDQVMCVVSIKLDGTNSLIAINEDGYIKAGSRNRWITPEKDNFGFAQFVEDNKEELLELGPGYHYGEWIGQGIQRTYGMDHRKLYLFSERMRLRQADGILPKCVSVVPIAGRCGITEIKEYTDAVYERRSGVSVLSKDHKEEGLIVSVPATGHNFKIIWDKS